MRKFLLTVLLTLGAASAASAQITFAQLDSGSDATDTAADAATAAISPTANKLVLLVVAVTGSTPAVTTVTGCSMTWDAIGNTGTGSQRNTMFRSISASPGSSCALAINTNTRTGILYRVVEVTGSAAVAGDNGAAAIIQSNVPTPASTNSLAATLSAFGSANNAGVEQCYQAGTNTFSVDTSPATWTQLSTTTTMSNPSTRFAFQYVIGSDTAPTCAWSGANTAAAIAAEIAAPAAGGGPNTGSTSSMGGGK